MDGRHLGWNAYTFSVVMTVLLSLQGGWSWRRQLRSIRDEKSGKAVNISWLIVACAGWSANIIWGFADNQIALVVLGVCRLPFGLPALKYLRKYKGFQWTETAMALAFSLMVCLMLRGIGNRYGWFIVLTSAGIPFACLQPREMLRDRSRGVVSLEVPVTTCASASFWIVYGKVAHNAAMFWTSVAYATIYGFIAALWVWYYLAEAREKLATAD